MTRRPSLYRTVLAVAVAALVAVILPFSVMYVNAVTNRAVVSWKSGHAVVTTKASGGQTLVSAGTSGQQQGPTAVVTRSS